MGNSEDGGEHFHTFLYNGTTMINPLASTIYDQQGHEAHGINDSGVIVGTLIGPGNQAAIRIDGSDVTILDAPFGPATEAKAINQHGQVLTNALSPHDPRIQTGNTVITVPGLPGAHQSFGVALNDHGQVIGQSYFEDFTIVKSFLYSGGATQELVSPFPDFPHVQANGLNNLGHVVGTLIPLETGESAAFLFDGSEFHILNERLALGPGLGSVLYEAAGINDHGQIIGFGLLNGEFRSFLLTPVPLPAAVWLFGSGLIGLAGLVRRRFTA